MHRKKFILNKVRAEGVIEREKTCKETERMTRGENLVQNFVFIKTPFKTRRYHNIRRKKKLSVGCDQ